MRTARMVESVSEAMTSVKASETALRIDWRCSRGMSCFESPG